MQSSTIESGEGTALVTLRIGTSVWTQGVGFTQVSSRSTRLLVDSPQLTPMFSRSPEIPLFEESLEVEKDGELLRWITPRLNLGLWLTFLKTDQCYEPSRLIGTSIPRQLWRLLGNQKWKLHQRKGRWPRLSTSGSSMEWVHQDS